MVRPRFRLRALTRKLLRDVWEMKSQALAIAVVVAAGVTMFVTYLSNFDSLVRTRTTSGSSSPTSLPARRARRRRSPRGWARFPAW